MNIRALVIAGLVLCGGSAAANAQYTITRSVIGAGMTPMSNGTYQVDGTIGQAVIGPVGGGGIFVGQGFWYTVIPTGGVKVNNVGDAAGFSLEQNYPNPFNPSTKIEFSVPEATNVTIRVMNLLGEEVTRIVDGVKYGEGKYSIEFSADDLPSGTYIYRMDAGTFSASKRMVLLK